MKEGRERAERGKRERGRGGLRVAVPAGREEAAAAVSDALTRSKVRVGHCQASTEVAESREPQGLSLESLLCLFLAPCTQVSPAVSVCAASDEGH